MTGSGRVPSAHPMFPLSNPQETTHEDPHH